MKVNFKKYVIVCFLLFVKTFLNASNVLILPDTLVPEAIAPVNESAWMDSLIKEGTDKIVAAELWNLEHPEEPVSYTIVLDAKKWITTDESKFLPVLEKDKWHYESGDDGDFGDAALVDKIETALKDFNGPRQDKLRMYTMLIRNFPLKVGNPKVKIPTETTKNLFNQLVELGAIDYKHYDSIAKGTFKAVVDKILTEAGKTLGYEELILPTVAHMSFRYGPDPKDEKRFVTVYNAIGGKRLNDKTIHDYLLTDFKRQALKPTETRATLLSLVNMLSESVHCSIDGQCEAIAEPGKTFFETWKNQKGVSQMQLRLIAKYINLCGTDIYKDFQIVRDQPQGNWQPYQFDAYKDQIEKFWRFYHYFQDELDNIHTQHDMIMVCRHLSKTALGVLSAKQRLQILNKINEGSLNDLKDFLAFFNNGYGGENVAVNVLSTTPEGQYADMFQGIQKGNLVNELMEKVDDSGIGGENFTKLVFSIIKFIPKNTFNNDWQRILDEGKVFKCSNGKGLFSGSDNFIINRGSDGKLEVIMSMDGGLDFRKIDLDPFETIGILTKRPLPYLEGLPKTDDNYEAAVPAIYLYWLKEKESTTRTYQLAGLAVNVLGVVTGVGVVANAATWTVRIIGVLDVAAGAVGTGLDIIPVEDIIIDKYGKESDEYRFYQNTQLILTVYNGVSAAANLLKLPKKLDDAIIYWKNSKNNKLIKDGIFSQTQIEKLNVLFKETTVILNETKMVSSLERLVNKACSQNISWANRLDTKYLIWADENSKVLSTAEVFMKETGATLYDAVLTNRNYVKFDYADGRILLGNLDGEYHAFAVINKSDLTTFQSSVMQVSDDVFKTRLSEYLVQNASKLEVLSGVTSKQLVIAGKAVTTSTTKVNTILGRFRPDIQGLFNELGSYKNVGLGEVKGGINILNKPDFYYDATTWWNSYNKPWLDAVIQRGDDVYLATIPKKAEDIIDASGNLTGAYAQELDYLATKKYKPINVSDEEWDDILIWLKKSQVDAAGRQVWKGFTNIFEANASEILAAKNRIKNFRATGNLTGGNYGYLEGTVNNKTIDNKMWRSVSSNDAENEIHIFDAIEAQGASGTWLRITDSEYRMLNKLASELGGVKGSKYPNISGELKIVSENKYCASCAGIIQQFHDMYPNIKLILVDGAK